MKYRLNEMVVHFEPTGQPNARNSVAVVTGGKPCGSLKRSSECPIVVAKPMLLTQMF